MTRLVIGALLRAGGSGTVNEDLLESRAKTGDWWGERWNLAGRSSAVAGFGRRPDAGPGPKVAAAGGWSLPVDVTGDADASAERDRIQAILKPVLANDGGMLWDAATKTLTIQMTSSAALQQARGLVSAVAFAPSFRIEYAQVQYAADDLEALSANC